MKKVLIFLFISLIFLFGFSDSNKTIYLDPGHGGFDGGASYLDIYEKDLSLEISLKLRDSLILFGYNVLLTRDKDIDYSNNSNKKKKEDLNTRIKMIKESNCDLFISIHLNSSNNESYKGSQVFYTNNNSNNEIISKSLQDSLKSNLKNTHRNHLLIKNIYLLDNLYQPGCLVEVGFLSNKEERELLLTKDYQNKLVLSIVEGINNYFNI